VARRIFALFVLCAIVPIVVLAIISFTEVTRQLSDQSRARLRQGSKAVGMSIYERLLFLEADMKMIAANLRTGGFQIKLPPDSLSRDFQSRFASLALAHDPARQVPLFGQLQNPPEFTEAERRHLSSGRAVISVQRRQNLPARTLMSCAADPRDPTQGVLIGEIEPAYLWGLGEENTLPPLAELCVLDGSYRVLACSFAEAVSFAEQIKSHVFRSSIGEFEWRRQDKGYLAGYWSLPLKFNFFVPHWTVVLLESKPDILAPTARFTRIFPLVILMFLGMVLLLILSQIKRILVPLEKLHEGTRRIAMRDFGSRVIVRSRDEFEELAASFNMMADRLARQFNALATMADIDRAILSVLDTEKIVRAVLARMPDVLSCDAIAVTVIDSQNRADVHVSGGTRSNEVVVEKINLTPEALGTFHESPQYLLLSPDGSVPDYLAPLARRGCSSFLSLPVFFKESLSAVISLGFSLVRALDDETLLHARQIADQVAIAISNSRLYQQLGEQALSLEKANRVKDEFLSVMSHELRTPLTVVKGYTGMHLEGLLGQINQEQEKALRLVMTRTNDLSALITTILEATRIESETIEVIREEVDLRALIETLKAKYSFWENKNITMSWEYPLDLPVIRTDSEKLAQILENLINNALKFTAEGSVMVSARREDGNVEFNVHDTGVGIPADALPVIFEKFRQLDSSDNRPYEGAGLGLYIAKTFTELLEGRLEVASEPGKGSRFSVKIPCS
jgi:signal transduction histidine kinase